MREPLKIITPKEIKDIGKSRYLKDLCALDRTVCSLKKEKVFSHWHGIGDLKFWSNNGIMGYFTHNSERRDKPIGKMPIQ